MQEALLTIVVVGLICVGFPWMAAHLTFGQQMAVCGCLIVVSLALPILHDWLSP